MSEYIVSEAVPVTAEETQLGLFGAGPTDATAALPTAPIRPLQYLGAKGRAISAILAQAEALNPARRAVLDAFSGSSVVSQAFAQAGFPVVANDALAFCTGLASTFLGIGYEGQPTEATASALAFLAVHRAPNAALWDDLQATETTLLARGGAHALSAFYLNLPLIWRIGAARPSLHAFFRQVQAQAGQPAHHDAGLVASYYAGSYFGVRQAVELDRLRHGIEVLTSQHRINLWQRNLLLSALTSTLSAAVHSAGKHFAQPINLANPQRAEVLLRRLLDDRRVNVWTTFRQQVHRLSREVPPPVRPHFTLNQPLETLYPEMLPPVGLVYADPPYTAQQYSRFYHVPEVVYQYDYPRLQQVNGAVTSGLYPAEKFKSAFCSKTNAETSFRCLFKLSRDLDADLLISYSASVSGKTGNDRMISLAQLCELGSFYFGPRAGTVNQLNFAYRQFNAGTSAVAERQDKEILLSFTTRDK